MAYFAELAPDQTVLRVIVADPGWPEANLGGTWVQTDDPYSNAPNPVVYTGPGHGYDPTFPEHFAPPWAPWDGTFDETNKTPYQVGSLAFHDGRIWKSTTPNNVWEPGVSGWHDNPIGGELPIWVQPTGAHDAYPIGTQVQHNGHQWESTLDANVWEPGVAGWRQLDVPVGPQPWVQPTGAGDAYPLGARVTHNGQTWENTGSAANVWEPGVFGWVVVPA